MPHSEIRPPDPEALQPPIAPLDPLRFDAVRDPVPRSNGLIFIIWMLVATVVILLAFSYYSLGLLSAARAFVGGEGLWSKAQKDAMYALTHYTLYRNPVDFQTFQDSLAVNLGDRRARIELEKTNPDFRVAWDGLVQGRNHPEDIDGMIQLFRSFRRLAEIDKAIGIWARADDQIDALLEVGTRIHAAVQANALDSARTQQFLLELDSINRKVTPLEDDFSYTLGQASRRAKALLLVTMFVAVSALLATAFMLSRRLLRQALMAEAALREGEDQLRSLLKFAPLPLVIVRISDEAIIYANDPALQQFRLTQASLSSVKSGQFYANATDRDAILEALGADGSIRNRELQMKDAQGNAFWALLSSRRISYAGHDCQLSALTNVDEHQRAQDALRHRAFHDELTGLPNRAMFLDALKRTMSNIQRKNGTFSILFIDLDHFKLINDSWGHDVGDQLLQLMATRLRSSVRDGDMVARMGGDEFVVLIEELAEREDVAQVAQNIRKALCPDYLLADQPVTVTSSIGISTYPHDGTDLNQLIKSADAAMYRAKELGRDNFQFSVSPTPDAPAPAPAPA